MSISFSASLIRELYENPEPAKSTDKKVTPKQPKNIQLDLQKEDIKADAVETLATN